MAICDMAQICTSIENRSLLGKTENAPSENPPARQLKRHWGGPEYVSGDAPIEKPLGCKKL